MIAVGRCKFLPPPFCTAQLDRTDAIRHHATPTTHLFEGLAGNNLAICAGAQVEVREAQLVVLLQAAGAVVSLEEEGEGLVPSPCLTLWLLLRAGSSTKADEGGMKTPLAQMLKYVRKMDIRQQRNNLHRGFVGSLKHHRFLRSGHG